MKMEPNFNQKAQLRERRIFLSAGDLPSFTNPSGKQISYSGQVENRFDGLAAAWWCQVAPRPFGTLRILDG
jgi:hypothetical protein